MKADIFSNIKIPDDKIVSKIDVLSSQVTKIQQYHESKDNEEPEPQINQFEEMTR
jgi:hypothetical protein